MVNVVAAILPPRHNGVDNEQRMPGVIHRRFPTYNCTDFTDYMFSLSENRLWASQV
jgi:hypothetical protein